MFRRLRTLWRLSGSDPAAERTELWEWLQTTNDKERARIKERTARLERIVRAFETRLTKLERRVESLADSFWKHSADQRRDKQDQKRQEGG